MNDPDEAVVGADAVYVKSWGSLKHFGDPEAESAFRADLRDWRLTADRLSGTREGKAFDRTLWFSDTYVRTRQGWKYFFGQASLPLPK